MSVRPAQIRYLNPGKALGAAMHKGWAATWNWVLSFVAHFSGGKGCKLENASNGHPRLDVLIESGDGVDVTCAGDGQPYVISIADGGDGDGDGGETIDIEADPDRFVEVDGKTLYASVRQDEETGTTLVGLTEQAPDDEDGGDGYCNDISHDDDENAISGEGGGAGMGFGMGASDDAIHNIGNDISYWPCKKQDDAGDNDL